MQKIKKLITALFKRERSFNSIVIANFILFSGIFFAMVIIGLLGFSHLIVNLSEEYYYYDDLSAYEEFVENKEFDKINLDFLKDKAGWIVVKDSEKKVLYEYTTPSISKDEKQRIINEKGYDSVGYYYGEHGDEVYIELFVPEYEYFKKIDQEMLSYSRLGSYIFFGFVIIIYLVTVVLIAKLLSNRIRKPINSMKYVMQNFTDQKKAIPERFSNIREFSDLFRVLNEMTDALNKGEEERLELEKSRMDMLASLSHDIKTPLASIQGYSKAIQDGYVEEDKLKGAMELIESKSNEVIDMVNLLHEYIKLEHTAYQLTKKSYDIVEALRVWLAECYDEIDSKGYHLEINLPDYKIMHLIDVFHLRRAMMNLIYNAVNHNQPGITIAVTFDCDDEFYHIWLEDTGKGLPDMSGKQLFSPFSKGDDSRTSKGSGLGLAIAWQIIRLHDGQLLIEPGNETYKTRFHIKFKR